MSGIHFTVSVVALILVCTSAVSARNIDVFATSLSNAEQLESTDSTLEEANKKWNNGELPGSDIDFGPAPGKRWNGNLFDHSNGGLPGVGGPSFGKRWNVNLFDDGNTGLPGSGAGLGGGFGKRWNVNLFDDTNNGLPGANTDFGGGFGKRWSLNLFDEGNGGLPGANTDFGGGFGKRRLSQIGEGHLTPGKKCVNLMNGSCGNTGLPGAGDDIFTGGPGKRHLPQKWFYSGEKDGETGLDGK